MPTSLKDTSKPWSKIAEKWLTYFKPPSRPSIQEVKTYHKWLKSYAPKSKKALVLGATPELLDILSEEHIESDLIDINKEMVQAMTAITKDPAAKRGVTIGNWLEMPFKDNTYDLVLGDAVVPNVPYESRHQFIREIKRILKPDGLFLNRAFNAPAKKPYDSINEILLNFREKDTNETTALELVFEIQILTWDAKDHLGSMPKVRAAVEKLRIGNSFTRGNTKENELLNILWEYWLKDISDKVWVYDLRANEEASLYLPNFKIIETFEAKDHPYGQYTPLYLLENRS